MGCRAPAYDAIKVSYVTASALSEGRLDEIQKAFGFSITAKGLCADAGLRRLFAIQPTLRYDWVHTLLQDGSVTVEARLLIKACEEAGVVTLAALIDFLKKWERPRHWQKLGRHKAWQVFEHHANSEEEKKWKLKCGCSELLSLYGLLRVFFEMHAAGVEEVEPQLRSFLLCCKAVDIIMLTKARVLEPRAASPRLLRAVSAHLRAHLATYGDAHVKPKHHWAFDVAEQMLDDDVLVDCLIIERLHLRARRIADNVTNTAAYETSVLSGILNYHCRQVADAPAAFKAGLVGRTALWPEFPGVTVADQLHVGGFEVTIGDVVACGASLGFAVACASEHDQLFVVVDSLSKIDNVRPPCLQSVF